VNRFAGFVIEFLVLVAVLIQASAPYFELVAGPSYLIRAGRLLAVGEEEQCHLMRAKLR
jgi:hypothetical protein